MTIGRSVTWGLYARASRELALLLPVDVCDFLCDIVGFDVLVDGVCDIVNTVRMISLIR